jgi:hypothetical protein
MMGDAFITLEGQDGNLPGLQSIGISPVRAEVVVSAAKAADAKRARQHDAVDVVAVAGGPRRRARVLIQHPRSMQTKRAAEGNLLPICLLQPTQKAPLEAAGQFSARIQLVGGCGGSI